jgi:hypothetical protein
VIRNINKRKNTTILKSLLSLVDEKEDYVRRAIHQIYSERRVKKTTLPLENICTYNIYNDFNWCVKSQENNKTYPIILVLKNPKQSLSDFTIIGRKEYLFLAREMGLSEIDFYYDFNISLESANFIIRRWLSRVEIGSALNDFSN